jgi:hypothetical protein
VHLLVAQAHRPLHNAGVDADAPALDRPLPDVDLLLDDGHDFFGPGPTVGRALPLGLFHRIGRCVRIVAGPARLAPLAGHSAALHDRRRARGDGVGASGTAAASPQSSSSMTERAGDAQGLGEQAEDRGHAARERTAGADQATRERILHPQQAGHSSQLAKDAPADAVRAAGDRGAEAQKAAEAKAREAERRAREIGEAAKEAAKSEIDRQNLGGGKPAKP